MPIFPAATRLDKLARLGLSEPLIRLAAGELIHPLFDPRFIGPPDYVYLHEEEATSFSEPVLVPLWYFADGVQGVWERNERLQFIDYYTPDPEEFECVAETEQGFLAWMFLHLHRDNLDHPEDLIRLPEAAKAIGFHHYSEWLAEYESAAPDVGADEDWFILHIDRLKTSRDRRRR